MAHATEVSCHGCNQWSANCTLTTCSNPIAQPSAPVAATIQEPPAEDPQGWSPRRTTAYDTQEIIDHHFRRPLGGPWVATCNPTYHPAKGGAFLRPRPRRDELACRDCLMVLRSEAHRTRQERQDLESKTNVLRPNAVVQA